MLGLVIFVGIVVTLFWGVDRYIKRENKRYHDKNDKL